MGASKIPLYAYVDETGNTGHNLFDEAQPDFYTAALITKGDFDIAYADDVRAIAGKLGESSLHGKELGIARLEAAASDIIRLMERSGASFFVSRVEKMYLLATKVFDSIFDSGENAAISWHHYNIKPLKIILAFKVAGIIDVETGRLFWECILENSKQRAMEKLPVVCQRLLENTERLPDAGSREVLGQGLEWARDHPEAIQIYTDRRSARQGHFPNLVAFANLLDGLQHHSIRCKRKVARITHDVQGEFQKTLNMWHQLFTNASPETITWAGDSYSLQKVPGSDFQIKADEESPGLQLTDIVLWLYHKNKKNTDLPNGCKKILSYVFQNGWENDFSFSGVEKMMIEKWQPIMEAPLSEESAAEARQMLARMEEAREMSMLQYEIDQIPPFMRKS